MKNVPFYGERRYGQRRTHTGKELAPRMRECRGRERRHVSDFRAGYEQGSFGASPCIGGENLTDVSNFHRCY